MTAVEERTAPSTAHQHDPLDDQAWRSALGARRRRMARSVGLVLLGAVLVAGTIAGVSMYRSWARWQAEVSVVGWRTTVDGKPVPSSDLATGQGAFELDYVQGGDGRQRAAADQPR